MKLFRSKKKGDNESPDHAMPREITIPDWTATEFGEITPEQFKYFLEQAYQDESMHIEGKQLTSLALPVNNEFMSVQVKLGHYMTFGEWKTVIDNIINTGRSGIPGDNEVISMIARASFFEIRSGIEMLAQQYDDIRARSTMYFSGTDRGVR